MPETLDEKLSYLREHSIAPVVDVDVYTAPALTLGLKKTAATGTTALTVTVPPDEIWEVQAVAMNDLSTATRNQILPKTLGRHDYPDALVPSTWAKDSGNNQPTLHDETQSAADRWTTFKPTQRLILGPGDALIARFENLGASDTLLVYVLYRRWKMFT